ncbi:glutathione peroxidase [Psychromonas sp. KJ10-10]|uniref:glutathione peroxidase n=1 Tax=Psychromonas sp. KJ10-10 TaxID=3391823 RepID=UPI0039B57B32
MSTIYDIDVVTIDGQTKKMVDYAGKTLLIVNVASKCGLTPQYEQLEAFYEANKAKGVEVLGFPCNQFAEQEPGSDAEVMEFCRATFGIQFPMFAKIDVNGESRHPLYQVLIEAQPERTTLPDGELKAKLQELGLLNKEETDVMWNFEKFLISPKGEVVGRFAPDMTIEHSILVDAIATQLK